MAFNGKYQLESEENHREFLKAIDFGTAHIDDNIDLEVVQNGNSFKWTMYTCSWKWSAEFTIGQECQMISIRGNKFNATVAMKDGMISFDFPEYHFTAEVVDDKLVTASITPGEDGVTLTRVFKRIKCREST